MQLTLIISIITFILLTASVLILPQIKVGKIKFDGYVLASLLGAIFLFAFSLAPISEILSELFSNAEINPLKILILFFSMTFLSVFLDETGLFTYLSSRAAALAKGTQFTLFAIVYLLTAVLTVFTSNDVVILTLTPFICTFCRHTDADPTPYLIGEFAAANTWSMALIIGNPTNIYLATSAGIGFGEYLSVMVLPTVAAGIVEFLLICLLFLKKFKQPLVKKDVPCVVRSKSELIIGAIHLGVCLIFLVISDYVGLQMWLISACCAISLLIFILIKKAIDNKNNKGSLVLSIKRLPWQLIPFVLSMFIITVAFKAQGISALIADFLGAEKCTFTYGVASYLASNLINNIPMSMLFSTLPTTLSGNAYYGAVYASVVGSNIGAFLTPVGALAGIMFTNLTKRYNTKYGFKEFLKYGAIISLPTLLTALVVLQLIIKS